MHVICCFVSQKRLHEHHDGSSCLLYGWKKPAENIHISAGYVNFNVGKNHNHLVFANIKGNILPLLAVFF